MTTTDKPTVYTLANLADVSSPDSAESPGAEWLALVHAVAWELIEDTDNDTGDLENAHDDITERADGVVPIYTHNKWEVFVDLCAWQEDLDDFRPFHDMDQEASVSLYLIAERLISVIVREEIDKREDEETE